jgi:hypothetical protein
MVATLVSRRNLTEQVVDLERVAQPFGTTFNLRCPTLLACFWREGGHGAGLRWNVVSAVPESSPGAHHAPVSMHRLGLAGHVRSPQIANRRQQREQSSFSQRRGQGGGCARGIIYDSGDLMWYRHEGRNEGTFKSAPTGQIDKYSHFPRNSRRDFAQYISERLEVTRKISRSIKAKTINKGELT